MPLRVSRTRLTVSVLILAALAAGAVTLLRDTGPHDPTTAPAGSAPTSETTPRPPATKPPQPPRQVVRVGWIDTAYDADRPPRFPGSFGPASVPWCRADDLSLRVPWSGGGGNIFDSATVTNVSSRDCALQGQPGVSVLDRSGRVLASASPDAFFVDAWIRLRPGDRASSEVDWLREFCHEPRPAVMRVALPHAGGELTATTHTAPACASASEPMSAGRLLLHGFLRRGVNRLFAAYTPEARLEARVRRTQHRVLQGNDLHYRVRLESYARGQIQLDPCLPYREQLVSSTGVVVAQQSFLLNCDRTFPQPDTPRSGFVNYYAMRMQVPASLTPGTYLLRWQSVLERVADSAGGAVVVAAAPPPCDQEQLQITAGRPGAGLGSFYAPVVFRNVSSVACGLRGYPGVEYVAPDGSALQTDPTHEPTIAVRTVVLGPGKAASAMLSGSDFGPNGGATPCPPTAGVRIIAPGLTTPVFVRAGVDYCNAGGISVSAVQPGRRPQP